MSENKSIYTSKQILDINDIRAILPHRYPFLLVDRVLKWDEGHIKALKNVTYNEPFFPGHFPDFSVMPGVLQIEAMAQVFCVFGHLVKGYDFTKDMILFMGVDKVRFRKPVVPGDQFVMEGYAKPGQMSRTRGSVEIKGYVNGELVTEGVMKAAILVGKLEEYRKGKGGN